jgi:hypothetical protein
MDYYEWISRISGCVNRIRASPYYPESNQLRWEADFEENINGAHDYNGEPVWLIRNNSPVERVA